MVATERAHSCARGSAAIPEHDSRLKRTPLECLHYRARARLSFSRRRLTGDRSGALITRLPGSSTSSSLPRASRPPVTRITTATARMSHVCVQCQSDLRGVSALLSLPYSFLPLFLSWEAVLCHVCVCVWFCPALVMLSLAKLSDSCIAAKCPHVIAVAALPSRSLEGLPRGCSCLNIANLPRTPPAGLDLAATTFLGSLCVEGSFTSAARLGGATSGYIWRPLLGNLRGSTRQLGQSAPGGLHSHDMLDVELCAYPIFSLCFCMLVEGSVTVLCDP